MIPGAGNSGWLYSTMDSAPPISLSSSTTTTELEGFNMNDEWIGMGTTLLFS